MMPLQEQLNNTWYAVAYSSDIEGNLPFATRLYGEPMVLYRDSEGEPTCVRDLCPHRSAPLSMGEVQDGVLRCFYHGWGFGKEGACVSVPTNRQEREDVAMPKSFCAASYAVVERDGLLWVWRGNTLSADLQTLPALAAAPKMEGGISIDTVLDYDCDWTVLRGRPPLGALAVQGQGSAAADGDGSTVPYIACHTDEASGVVTEAHIMPIAPSRSRVLLRQRLPDSSLLTLLASLPGALPLLTLYIRNANYKARTKMPHTRAPRTNAPHALRAWHDRDLFRRLEVVAWAWAWAWAWAHAPRATRARACAASSNFSGRSLARPLTSHPAPRLAAIHARCSSRLLLAIVLAGSHGRLPCLDAASGDHRRKQRTLLCRLGRPDGA